MGRVKSSISAFLSTKLLFLIVLLKNSLNFPNVLFILPLCVLLPFCLHFTTFTVFILNETQLKNYQSR